jgi:hypothetical protein
VISFSFSSKFGARLSKLKETPTSIWQFFEGQIQSQLVSFKIGDKSFFMFGFAKNQRENISAKELKALKFMAKELLGYSNLQLSKAVKLGELIKVKKL